MTPFCWVNANLIYGLQKLPAADHAHFRFRSSLGHAQFYFLLLLNSRCIKYSMYDVISVKLKQNLSTVFVKYQLEYVNFRSGTSLDQAHFYFTIIKYSMR